MSFGGNLASVTLEPITQVVLTLKDLPIISHPTVTKVNSYR